MNLTTQQSADSSFTAGFTLIELSIVLVIIGLIVGGVLVGRDLIAAAVIRSQITQIDKYKQATNTFRGKYNNYLPGDIPDPDASNFGFVARGSAGGQGDGNGQLMGGGTVSGTVYGENGLFWRDLSTVNLIDGSFVTATPATSPGTITATSTPALKDFLPIGALPNTYVSTLYGGCTATCLALGQGPTANPALAVNWFTLSNITTTSPVAVIAGVSNITVAQAFKLDQKIDDGLPLTGNVVAIKANAGRPYWSDGTSGWMALNGPPGPTPISSTTCFDTSLGNGQQYSITQDNGGNANCSIAFKIN